MDHFESIHLKNFGPWKDQYVEFHPGVNVIVGESGRGKSALLKSFDFIINNKAPKSANGALGFITRPEERGKIAEVILCVNGVNSGQTDTISRRKGKSVNEYQLNDDKPQKAMGVNVPEHIAKIFNMESVNFHKQKNLPFLLDEKPGQVAKQLTGIINLSEIDETVSLATSTARENTKKLKLLEEDYNDISSQIKQLEYVQHFKAKVDQCKQLLSALDKKNIEFAKVDTVLLDINALGSERERYSDLITIADVLDAIEAEQSKFELDSSKFDVVVELVNSIEDFTQKQKRCSLLCGLGEKIDENKQLLISFESKKQENIQIKKLSKEISNLNISSNKFSNMFAISGKVDNLDKQQKHFSELSAKYNNVLDISTQIEQLDSEQTRLKEKITIGEAELFNTTCPLCGRKN